MILPEANRFALSERTKQYDCNEKSSHTGAGGGQNLVATTLSGSPDFPWDGDKVAASDYN